MAPMAPRKLALASLVPALVATAIFGCSSNLGAPCTLDPCGIDQPPNYANTVCDLQVMCDSFSCLAYRVDGDEFRTPYCSAECSYDPDNVGAGCPPGWQCSVISEVVGPGDRWNCTVYSPDGTPRDARCMCIRCCDDNGTILPDAPEECTICD
jgi:hypothetical protein